MASKPSSSETTIQADVAPGDKTGIYYITICNLPFGSSWQELKDWLRQACTVDHIELFQTSTSGWVRLRGKDNFEKAWKHINSVDFKGRSIIASDKNRTESIKIKELVDSPSHSQDRTITPAPRAPYFPATSPIHFEPQHASAHYPAASYGQFYVQGYPTNPGGLSYPPSHAGLPTYHGTPSVNPHHPLVDSFTTPDPWAPSSPYSTGHVTSMGYMEPPTGVGSPTQSPYEGMPYALPYGNQPQVAYYNDRYMSPSETPGVNEYALGETRKILITSLPQRATADETISWVRLKAGSYGNDIVHVDVPTHDSKSRVRGHAYVILRNTVAAHAVLAMLDQAMFQNRKITARFVPEGVALDGSASQGSTSTRVHPRGTREETSKSPHAKQVAASASIPNPKQNSSSPTSNDGKSKGKEAKVYPVIADGSSRRRPDQNNRKP